MEELQTAAPRRGVQPRDPFVDRLTATGKVTVEHSFQATREGRRAAEPRPPLEFTVGAEPAAAYLLVVRHPLGAVTFHFPEQESKRRGGAAARPKAVRFRVEFPQDQDAIVAGERRGLASKIVKEVVKAVVVKIVDKAADKALGALAKVWENLKWRKLRQGWVAVTPETLRSGALTAADFSLIQPGQRNLLLLHGTFSNTASAFRELAATHASNGLDFFTALRNTYGDRIFGFNHFTVSKTPQQNARELLAGLPKAATFDVITHSRGGLVVRDLLETDFSAPGKRFQAGKVVLVASPNQGTPLATGARWKDYFQWIVNVAEVFPENAVTLGIEFAAEAIIWLAQRIKGGFPGLESMDMGGEVVKQLQRPPGPPPQSLYSALVSNFQPKGSVLTKLAEAGAGSFFQSANDLVVPSEGGWRVDAPSTLIPADRIGCFGNGGNLDQPGQDSSVYHTNYFSQPKTVDFLVETLTGAPHSCPPLDPAKRLPFGWRRGVVMVGPAAAQAAPTTRAIVPRPAAIPALPPEPTRMRLAAPTAECKIFQLFVISSDEHLPQDVVKKRPGRTALVLATYQNARALETIFIRGHRRGVPPRANAQHRASSEEGGALWYRIIDSSNNIRAYVNGDPKAKELPQREQLQTFGADLFAAMFPDSVRRLYDVARSEAEAEGRRLDVVVTSMINWIADKPFEFAYDPLRQAYLATEEVNFTRSVLTAVPDDRIPMRNPPMRMLVVAAQPAALEALSADEEEQLILRSFQDLERERLATVEVMLAATPDALHERLRSFAEAGRREDQFDIVHFIGHGEYNTEQDEGYLIFEDENGGTHPVSAECLREILCHRGVRMVFLNACETGTVGRSQFPFDFNRGVAPKLVGGGIGVVVANQYKVLDVSATEFAKHFYRAIAQGATVGDASREARVAVNYSITGECIDWAVPVVYARDPALRLFQPSGQAPRPAAAAARTRRARVPGVKRFGLWDINNVLPGLESIAQRFNEVQDIYRFEVADLSAPIGTWRLIASKPRGKAPATAEGVVRGDEVASKLSSQAAGLGFDRLFCITNFALGGKVKGQERSSLKLWNDDPSGKRIAIISARGLLSHFDNQSYPLGRFIANMIVTALCGDLEHTTGPKNCPNYVDRKPQLQTTARQLEYTTAKQQLCTKCGVDLRNMKQDKKALDKILAAY